MPKRVVSASEPDSKKAKVKLAEPPPLPDAPRAADAAAPASSARGASTSTSTTTTTTTAARRAPAAKLEPGTPLFVAFEAFLSANAAKLFSADEVESDPSIAGAMSSKEDLEHLLNGALEQHRIAAVKGAVKDSNKKSVLFRVKQPEETNKVRGLDSNQVKLYNLIRDSGDEGIWTRDLKRDAQLEPKEHEKALKVLEQRRLVKKFKSIIKKKKVLLILSEREPSRRHTGRPWYTESMHFDAAFVASVKHLALKVMREVQYEHGPDGDDLSVSVVHERLLRTGQEKMQLLDVDDVFKMLENLRYAGELVLASAMEGPGTRYMLAPDTRHKSNFFTLGACLRCPKADICAPRGLYNPLSCNAMDAYLGEDAF